ncbi:hypothetical protein AMTRI_Chr01g129220 [Amborella trichopoda]|uniref:DUF4228 domain-containing protein n=1 Tax=Amborella trichopoda TaxID=13333 RepID=U5D1Z4_AMBTC|nr:uncharacterized protein LOC18444564 [Amborella trichopoda]ERN16260.1 hypothetical protein AMTR_s00063p00151320 [Amborella trichopoda]|eukprot:XP_006854793.1 uncharacterized protein LOC18444564 [Amborella trichopoda]
MGNMQSPCVSFKPHPTKLVLMDGQTILLKGKKKQARQVMFQFPHSLVCHADSFYLGHRIPALSLDDILKSGETYFVIPADRFSSHVLSPASLASLALCPGEPLNFGDRPFVYVKGPDGKGLVKISPEFITGIMTRSEETCETGGNLCSTPELRKHYAQLVGPRSQPWSPKLDTIRERKPRSPCRAWLTEFRWFE